MVRDPFYRLAFKMLVILVGVILGTRFTGGGVAVLVVLYGIYSALTNKPIYALICYCLFPFMTILNPYVLPSKNLMTIAARLGMPMMAIAMLVSAYERRGGNRLPLAGIFFYVLIACISSMTGYCPKVSYSKLINFTMYVIGIYMGTKDIGQRPHDLVLIRAFLFAFAMLLIFGSFAVRVVSPTAAYYSSLWWEIGHGGMEEATNVLQSRMTHGDSLGFFCGITNHSQCLGPISVCVFGWLLSDMLFVERRFKRLHSFLILACPVLVYLTKSRTAMGALICSAGFVTMYCIPKFRLPKRIKARIRSVMMGFLFLMFAGVVVMQLTGHGVESYLRKHHADEDLGSAIVSSRIGLIEESLRDFRLNPLFGMGFQTSEDHVILNRSRGLIFSAPIEKGFIPTMILGETGIVGLIAFVVFLVIFYWGCTRRKYFVTVALFTVYLITNLGEASFFSPGGDGGVEWLITLAGGFAIDLSAICRKKMERLLEVGPAIFGEVPVEWQQRQHR